MNSALSRTFISLIATQAPQSLEMPLGQGKARACVLENMRREKYGCLGVYDNKLNPFKNRNFLRFWKQGFLPCARWKTPILRSAARNPWSLVFTSSVVGVAISERGLRLGAFFPRGFRLRLGLTLLALPFSLPFPRGRVHVPCKLSDGFLHSVRRLQKWDSIPESHPFPRPFVETLYHLINWTCLRQGLAGMENPW